MEQLYIGAAKALDAAIESIYAVFKHYRLGSSVVGCTHCTSEADDALLHSKSLRQLDGQSLHRFAFKALTTMGTMDDFKYFLPRLLELVARDGDVGGEWIATVLGKLEYGKWMTWPTSERTAVEEYIQALWQYALTRFPASLDIDDFLAAIGQAVDDMTPYLTAWRDNNSLPATHHLADFVADKSTDLIRGRSIGAYWTHRPVQMNQVIRWFLDPSKINHLERAFFNLPPDCGTIANELSQAITSLQWLLTSRGVTRSSRSIES